MPWPRLFLDLREDFRGIVRRYSKKSMNAVVLILVFVGAWPLLEGEQNRYLRFIRFLLYFAQFGNIAQIINSFYDISLKLDNVVLLSEFTIVTILTVKSIIRVALCIHNKQLIKKMVQDLDTLALKIVHEREIEIVKLYTQRSNLFTVGFFTVSLCFAIMFSMESLMEESRTLPGHTNLPFRQAMVTPIYEVLFGLITLQGFGIAGINAMGDAYAYSIIMNVTAHYKILQFKLEHIREHAVKEVEEKNQRKVVPTLFEEASRDATWVVDDGEGSTSEQGGNMPDESSVEGATTANPGHEGGGRYDAVPPYIIEIADVHTCREREAMNQGRQREPGFRNKFNLNLRDGRFHSKATLAKLRAKDRRDVDLTMKKYLGEIVQTHLALIRYMDTIQENFSYALLFELSVNSLMVAIDLFQIATVSSTLKFCLWCSFLLIHVVQIFAYCWAASEMEKESVNMVDALYFSDWLESPASYKRSIQIIMSRALQPTQLQGASFLPFNMEVFGNIMNSAYSYYGMVREMNLKK